MFEVTCEAPFYCNRDAWFTIEHEGKSFKFIINGNSLEIAGQGLDVAMPCFINPVYDMVLLNSSCRDALDEKIEAYTSLDDEAQDDAAEDHMHDCIMAGYELEMFVEGLEQEQLQLLWNLALQEGAKPN